MALRESDASELSSGAVTGTSVAGAITINGQLGTITTASLTTAAGADFTLTITNPRFDAGGQLFVTVGNGSNTTVPCYAHSVSMAEDSAVIKVRNAHASAALNGTLTIAFLAL